MPDVKRLLSAFEAHSHLQWADEGQIPETTICNCSNELLKAY